MNTEFITKPGRFVKKHNAKAAWVTLIMSIVMTFVQHHWDKDDRRENEQIFQKQVDNMAAEIHALQSYAMSQPLASRQPTVTTQTVATTRPARITPGVIIEPFSSREESKIANLRYQNSRQQNQTQAK